MAVRGKCLCTLHRQQQQDADRPRWACEAFTLSASCRSDVLVRPTLLLLQLFYSYIVSDVRRSGEANAVSPAAAVTGCTLAGVAVMGQCPGGALASWAVLRMPAAVTCCGAGADDDPVPCQDVGLRQLKAAQLRVQVAVSEHITLDLHIQQARMKTRLHSRIERANACVRDMAGLNGCRQEVQLWLVVCLCVTGSRLGIAQAAPALVCPLWHACFLQARCQPRCPSAGTLHGLVPRIAALQAHEPTHSPPGPCAGGRP